MSEDLVDSHAGENGSVEDDFVDDIPFGKPDPVESAETEPEKLKQKLDERERKRAAEEEKLKKVLPSMSDAETEKYKKKILAKDEKEKRLSPSDLRRNDSGNAQHFVDEYGTTLTYCRAWKTWLVWNERKWEEDQTGIVYARAKQCMKDLFKDSYDTRDSKMKEWAWQSGNRSKLEACIKLAEVEPGIPRQPEDYDSEPMIINLDNGIYNLKEDKMLTSDSSRYCTKIACVKHVPTYECDLWYDFLEKIMDGNTELIGFLQRACGYSLSGDTREQCFFVLQGPGANGKSTFVNTILSILGDYGAQLRSETIAVHRMEQIPTDIARLPGKRFVSVQETPQGCRLNESLMKQLTGGDRITARGLYQKEFEYIPQFKIWLSTNHKPRVYGRDLAIWRRIHLIPFNVIIPEPEQDKELLGKLMEEASGIFNWMIEGYRQWKQYGLIVPPEVQAATDEYRNDEDILADFIADKCERSGTIRSSELYDVYKEWAGDNGEKVKSNKWLSWQLDERGYHKIRTKKAVIWEDLSIKGVGL